MKASRLSLLVVVGCCLLGPLSVCAQDTPPPFAMDKEYSADVAITTKDSTTLQGRTFVSGDKLRSEMTMDGMAMVTIIRKDEKKIYQVMTAQKMVMAMPYDPDKFKGRMTSSFGPEGKFDLVGPETVDGVATTKYKVTSDKTKQVVYFWLDVANKVPVKMTTEDGAFSIEWKNYSVGPQDAALFEPPSNYQVMPMPDIPGVSSGGAQ